MEDPTSIDAALQRQQNLEKHFPYSQDTTTSSSRGALYDRMSPGGYEGEADSTRSYTSGSETPSEQALAPAIAGQTPSGNIVPQFYAPQVPSSRQAMGEARQLLGIGGQLANLGSYGARALDMPGAANVLGGMAQAGGYISTAMNIGKIIQGEGTTKDYMNLGTQAVLQGSRYIAAQTAAQASAAAGTSSAWAPTAVQSAATGVSNAASAVALPVAVIAAAVTARNMFGELDKPYGERSPWGKATATPVMGGPPALMGAAGMSDSNYIAKPFNRIAALEEKIVGEPLDLAFQGKIDSSLKQFAGNVVESPAQAYNATIGALTGSDLSGWKADTFNDVVTLGATKIWENTFCFHKGAPIMMADGSRKPVEAIQIGDVCEGGGMVTATGVALSNDLYSYSGVLVTGSHAVFEGGEWKRVRDAKASEKINSDKVFKVYIVNNENHILISMGITFSDYGEVTNSDEMTASQRLEYLNANRKV